MSVLDPFLTVSIAIVGARTRTVSPGLGERGSSLSE